MSLVRLIWVLVTAAYLAAGGLVLLVLVPPMVDGLEAGLHAQSQARADTLASGLAATASTTGDEPAAAGLSPATLAHWKALAVQESWATFQVLGPDNKPLAEHQGAPGGWESRFTRGWKAAPATAPLGPAAQRLGTLRLTMDTRPANSEVRRALLLWGLLFGTVGGLTLLGLRGLERWARAPLASFYAQIEGLSERRFVAVPQPRVAEWADLARVLNVLVARIQQMLEERDQAISGIMNRLEHDEGTGAASRDFFMASLKNSLRDEFNGGGVAIVRINDLEGINRRHGRTRTDEFLMTVATALRARLLASKPAQEHVLARLNGADFALLLPGIDLAAWRRLGDALGDSLQQLATDGMIDQAHVAWIGGSTFLRGESVSDVLVRVDGMVMQSEHEQRRVCFTEPDARQHIVAIAQWRRVIEEALETGHLALECHPVLLANGALLHREGELRLIRSDGSVVVAREFIPPAIRSGRISDLDLKAVQLALAELGRAPALNMSVNIAAQSLLRPIFQRQVLELLKRHAATTPRLWLEMRDPGTLGDSSPAVMQLCEIGRQTGCRVGLDHFGVGLTLMPLLQDRALRYVKLAPEVCAASASHPAAAGYVRMLAELAARHHVQVVACDVQTEADVARLAALGVHAFTGPGVVVPSAVPA